MLKDNQYLKVRPAIVCDNQPAIEFALIETRDGELFSRSRWLFADEVPVEPRHVFWLVDLLLQDDLYPFPNDAPQLNYSFIGAVNDLLPELDRASLESQFWKYALNHRLVY